MRNRYCLFIVMLFLSSCSSISGIPERSSDVKSELAALKDYFSTSVVTTYQSKPTDADKKLYRNEVISARIRAIDLNFNEFVQNISAENKKLNIGADSTVLFLGTAGAVSTVSSTQAILSATSATVTGVKSSVDKNAYYETTLNALVSQMLANRKTVLVNIYAGLESEVEDYPLMRALIDVEDYFQAGTIIGAVSEITKEAGKQKAEAEEKISDIVFSGSYVKDEAGDALRGFWKPDGKNIDKGNEKKLKEWMKKNKINVKVTVFLRDESFSKARGEAIKYFNIH